MPDQSCRVCYECDSQFTVINRRHHCRVCGRVFCGKCTENTVPAPTANPGTSQEEREKIRACNYCYKQWKKGIATFGNGTQITNGLSTSPSATSLASTRSSGTGHSSSVTFGSVQYSVEPYQRDQHSTGPRLNLSSLMETGRDGQSKVASGRCNDLVTDIGDLSSNQYETSVNRLVNFLLYIFLNEHLHIL